MATELVRMQATEVPDQIDISVMEKVMVQGDLAKLSAAERLNFYGSLCKSLRLNPLTCPFEYLNLNNKLRLYAKKECTEQLRQIRNVSVTITSRDLVEGCFVVTARATLPSGRQDESTGAVAIASLQGEARANAMMKAETKAKRRVTLSICGLAFLDESELESVRDAKHVTVDHQTGEVAAPPRKRTTPFNILGEFGKLKRRFTKLGKEDIYYTVLPKYGVEHSDQFPATDEGTESARAAYRDLKATVERLEAAPVPPLAGATLGTPAPPKVMGKVKDWADLDNQPDWVEVAGVVYHYDLEQGKYEPWIPSK